MDRINSALYIENEALLNYAAASARVLHPEGESGGAACGRALRQSYRDIRRCHEDALRRYGQLTSVPAEWEWLLDNFYMVQREYQAILPTLEKSRSEEHTSELQSLG